MSASAQPAAQADPGDENGRYHRQTLISWWEQSRLAAARVLVVGAGALGNELVKNLALAGVGTVVVVDMDHVENSNLARCVFFRPSDEGKNKAEVVCAAAAELNPEVTFHAVAGDVREAIGLGSYRGFDLVLGGLDNREARLHVNRCAWKAGIPWIDGAIEGLMGVVKVFSPTADSSCYECTMSARDWEIIKARRACSMLTREEMLGGKVPTTGTSASVIAAMQVQEAIKLLHDDLLPSGMAGRGFAFNGMTHDSYTVEYPRNHECLSHDTYGLGEAITLGRDVTMRSLVTDAVQQYGEGSLIAFEHDLLLGFRCGQCGQGERVAAKPIWQGKEHEVLCPNCGATREPEWAHSVGLDDEDHLLELTADSMHLPPADVLTLRTPVGRLHYVFDDPDPWDFVEAVVTEEEVV